MNRQKTLLFILLIVLVTAVMYAYLRMPRQKTVEKLKFSPGRTEVVREQKSVKVDDRKLHLELLDQPFPNFSGYKRNIFFLPSFAPKQKLPPPPPPPTSLPKPPPPAPPPTPGQIQQEAAKAEMAKFTFLGFLKKENKKLIFLSKDKEVFIVQQGDKIANNYEVTKITDDVLTIHSNSGGGELIMPLLENQPLNTSPRK